MSPANAEIVWQQLSENAAQQGASILCVRIGEATESGLLVCIGDDGAAISKSNREHLFDPFFTTRREQGGTGMGLGIAQAMLRSHGGSISLSQDEDYKFEIRWPL